MFPTWQAQWIGCAVFLVVESSRQQSLGSREVGALVLDSGSLTRCSPPHPTELSPSPHVHQSLLHREQSSFSPSLSLHHPSPVLPLTPSVSVSSSLHLLTATQTHCLRHHRLSHCACLLRYCVHATSSHVTQLQANFGSLAARLGVAAAEGDPRGQG